jgi:hypothetical protein
VQALREPVAQLRLVLAQLDAGDAGLREAEFPAPALDLVASEARSCIGEV